MNRRGQKPKLETRYSIESTEMKRQMSTPDPDHRYNTIPGRRTSATPGSVDHRVIRSPLKRFREAKDEISRTFLHIKNCLVEVQKFLKEALGEGGEEKVTSLVEKTKGIEEVLDRDHMKVAFFGRTSNGKSTVINALLRDRVLPMGIGHTTNCFCSVRGVPSSEGYVLIPGSEERNNVTILQKLVHSLHKDRLSESSLLNIYWPQTKCALLQEDVEFVDSPGVDMNPNLDDWINQHCLDADVFVLVSNAESTLINVEKNFFHRVSERLSQPNIFILNNRWDAAAAEEREVMEGVKKQHLERDVEFLTQELKVTDERTAAKRVYFVSAREVLLQRIRKQNNEKDLARGFADGYGQRLVEFEQFEHRFKECLSSSAIHTKFEKHHQRGDEIITELEELLREEERKIHDRSGTVYCDLEVAKQYKQRLESEGRDLKVKCERTVSETVSNVEKEFSLAIGDVIQQFADVTEAYNGQFDLQHLESYKAGLFEHVDNSLRQMLEDVSSSTLSSLHHEACANIINCYQRLLEVNLTEPHQLSSQARAPEISYVLCCADLCQDFREDLDFHFSFGIDRLTRWFNSGAILFNAQQQLSQLSSIIPPDLVFPLSVIFGGMVLSRVISWRFLLPSFGIYCGVYVYEKFMWTERSQEQALRHQFVTHLKSKFELQVRAIRSGYTIALDRGLRDLLKSLGIALCDVQTKQDQKIRQLQEEESLLTRLQGQVHSLRNNVRHLKTYLEAFKEDYLNGVD